MDASVPALRRAAAIGLACVVADTWAGLPLRAGCVDALLCVFAPRNAAEFSRVLSGAGRVVVAAPTTAHLAGLRAELGLLDVADGKADRLVGQMGDAGLDRVGNRLVEFEAAMHPGAAARPGGHGPERLPRARRPARASDGGRERSRERLRANDPSDP